MLNAQTLDISSNVITTPQESTTAMVLKQQIPATILVVEDHALLRLTLRRWLEVKFPDCHVTEACNSDEALTSVQITPPKIIIVDIGLPSTAGLTTLKSLRQTLPTTPIVALASFDSDTTRNHALTDGASVFIEKRRVLSELQPALNKFLFVPDVEDDISAL